MRDFSRCRADYSPAGCVASSDHNCCAFCRNRDGWLALSTTGEGVRNRSYPLEKWIAVYQLENCRLF
jgi:hypothetical protein